MRLKLFATVSLAATLAFYQAPSGALSKSVLSRTVPFRFNSDAPDERYLRSVVNLICEQLRNGVDLDAVIVIGNASRGESKPENLSKARATQILLALEARGIPKAIMFSDNAWRPDYASLSDRGKSEVEIEFQGFIRRGHQKVCTGG